MSLVSTGSPIDRLLCVHYFACTSQAVDCRLKKMFKSLTAIRQLGTGVAQLIIQTRHLNAHSGSIGSIGRALYARSYPTTLVFQDGSTITIRYKEPRHIIKLPLDLSKLSESERQKYLEARKPKKKVKIEEDIEDNFDADSYSHLWKK